MRQDASLSLDLEGRITELLGRLYLPGQRNGLCCTCCVWGQSHTAQGTQNCSEKVQVNYATIQSKTCHIRLSCSAVLDLSLHQRCVPACLAIPAVGPSTKCLIALKKDQPTASGSHCELKSALSIAYRFPVIIVEAYWFLCIHWDTKTSFLMLFEGSTIQRELERIMWNCSLWFTYLCKGFFWGWILLLMAVGICPGLVITDTSAVTGEKGLGNILQLSEWHPWIILTLCLRFLFFSHTCHEANTRCFSLQCSASLQSREKTSRK